MGIWSEKKLATRVLYSEVKSTTDKIRKTIYHRLPFIHRPDFPEKCYRIKLEHYTTVSGSETVPPEFSSTSSLFATPSTVEL